MEEVRFDRADRTAQDAGDFLVLVRSSFAGYLGDWLLDAASEYRSAALT